MVNIWAGTTDRNLLENDWCRPDHIMNCSITIPWVRDHVRNGAKDSGEHPSMMIDWHMTDDIRPHIEMLNAMGMNSNITMWERVEGGNESLGGRGLAVAQISDVTNQMASHRVVI